MPRTSTRTGSAPRTGPPPAAARSTPRSGAATPRAGAALSSADLDAIRAALANNRRPKVVFTAAAGQIAGQTGQVIELTDPADSPEWIVVRFGHDELPFAPSDLALPGRETTTPTRTPAAKANARTSDGSPGVKDNVVRIAPPDRDAGPPSATAKTVGRNPAETVGRSTGAETVGRNPAADSATSTQQAATPAPLAGSAPAPRTAAPTTAAPAPAKATKAAKPKAVPSLVVTLSYTDREWTVAAVQGTRSLAKPYVIRPVEALKIVALIDVPGVGEAVEAIIAAERAETEGRAARLRAELADVEARLAELTT
jgi:hypothetical protein